METVWVVAVLVVSLPAMLGVAWTAARLSGVSRSWVRVVVSGALGWVIGFGLALWEAGGDLHERGFVTAGLAFSVVATMFAAVILDLLAKPGSLATGEEAGLFVVPHPLRDARARLEPVAREREIVRILRANGFGPLLGHADRAVHDADPVEVRVRRSLEQCGGMFVKLGQVASTRTELLPSKVVAELSRLQASAEPAPVEEVRAQLEADLQRPIDEVFASFDWEPLAAASIAQVHVARLHDGTEVVVKVRRPGIERLVELDTGVLLQLARNIETRTPYGRRYRIFDTAQEFALSLRDELDFTIEAKNAQAIAAELADVDTVRIPRVYEGWTGRRMLVQERLTGAAVGDRQGLAALDVDRHELADRLLEAFLTMMFERGHFHADPHPGNVFVLPDGTLGLIDFGNCGLLDPLQRDALVEMMVATIQRDAAALRDAVSQVAVVDRETDPEDFERSLAHFMAVHVAPGAGVDAAALTDLLHVLDEFGIRLPAGLTSFCRAFAILDGTLDVLCPGYRLAEAMQRLGQRFVAIAVDDRTPEEIARDELIANLPSLRRLPRQLDRLVTGLNRGEIGVRVSRFSTPEERAFVTRVVNRALLALVAGAWLLASAVLAVSDAGPGFSGDTTLLNAIGYAGLVWSTILLLRVTAGVVREGAD
ncbi:MAG: AarF/UbiB family protein [Acidimicrobiales bacterium]|jgi:ubiquinone biosynthesis protein|nr:AarF/UbiB family protein [Acidimicrobiales bacterium]